MPLSLRFADEDLLRCRFAVSPLCETHEAVRTLLRPARHGFHRSWLPRAEGLDLGPLPLVMPAVGYTPDFLGPPPDNPLGRVADFADEIARLRATDPALASEEMLRSFESTGTVGPRELLDDPAAAVQAFADATERAWEALVAPGWDRLRDVLEADIALRSRQLAEGGLRALFADLHPDIGWDDGTLELRGRGTALGEQALAGRGLLLMPSVFSWPDMVSGFAPNWQPTIIYPARGMARAWEPARRPAVALARLLGTTRATLLTTLDDPASTTFLAARHDLAPSTVSEHLAVLRDAGLVDSRRTGHEVRYRRTPLGDAVLQPSLRATPP